MLLLPAGLSYSRNGAFVAQFPETNPAHFEFAHISMRTSADFAAVVFTNFELRFVLPFFNQSLFGHRIPSFFKLSNISKLFSNVQMLGAPEDAAAPRTQSVRKQSG
jgi:hypothetical protein